MRQWMSTNMCYVLSNIKKYWVLVYTLLWSSEVKKLVSGTWTGSGWKTVYNG